MKKASDHVKEQHTFEGEMRVKVNKRIHPNITEVDLIEAVQRIMEGETVEGIEVETFNVRGEDKLGEIKDFDFAAGFMRNARQEESGAQTGSKKSKAKSK
jgi:hypothetical protein